MPPEHKSFIHILKEHGYVTGRSQSKTWGPGSLDDWITSNGSHPCGDHVQPFEKFLEDNGGDQPFFYWLGTTDPHRPFKKGAGVKNGMDLGKIQLFKHFPDAETIRSDVADYYVEVERWDSLVGTVIHQLETNDLLDNTIIIITGDHGMPFPRCKVNLYDSGVRVPFAIRWGRGIKGGRYVEDFISLADVAPTFLDIMGIPIPAEMTGRSFADVIQSEEVGWIDPKNRGDVVFGRERHVPAQKKPHFGGYPSRGYRNTEYLYIRNYNPELWPAGTGLPEEANIPGQWYADCDGGPTKDYIVNNNGKDADHQRSFQLCFAKRPEEELYDLSKDPDQVFNIADDPKYVEVLKEMRKKLQRRLELLNDPRALEPEYTGFDDYPYLGGSGGVKK